MVGTRETEEQQDVVKRLKQVCLECVEAERQKIVDNTTTEGLKCRSQFAGNQAAHPIGQVNLLERHVEEKERELAQPTIADEALINLTVWR